MTKGEELVAKLKKLDDGIARSVPISERNCAGEAAKVIQACLADQMEWQWEVDAVPALTYLFDDVWDPTSIAPATEESPTSDDDTDPIKPEEEKPND